jgi:hypothetical protein
MRVSLALRCTWSAWLYDVLKPHVSHLAVCNPRKNSLLKASGTVVGEAAQCLEKLSEQQLNDLALNFLRTQLITVPGAVAPLPYGGKQRQVMVNMNQNLMQAKGVSPSDVLNAVNAQNLIVPLGTAKVAESELDVRMNVYLQHLCSAMQSSSMSPPYSVVPYKPPALSRITPLWGE